MKVAVLSNDVVPGMGLPCGGQGMRAHATCWAFRDAGVEACILLAEDVVRERSERWGEMGMAGGLCLPPEVRVHSAAHAAVAVAGFDVAVLHNWAAARHLPPKGAMGARVVYDFFSATTVEHTFLGNAEHMAGVLARKRAAVSRADLFWGNGPGRVAHAREWLARNRLGGSDPLVLDVPFAPLRADEGSGPRDASPPILLGGFRQAWAPVPDASVADAVAEAFAEREVIQLGGNEPYHRFAGANAAPNERAGSRPVRRRGLLPLAFEPYAALLAAAAALVDVAPMNAERRVSHSSRALMALGLGCPVIHNAGTDLGAMIERYDAGATIEVSDGGPGPHDVVAALRRTLDRDRTNCCGALMDELAARARVGVARTMEALA